MFRLLLIALLIAGMHVPMLTNVSLAADPKAENQEYYRIDISIPDVRNATLMELWQREASMPYYCGTGDFAGAAESCRKLAACYDNLKLPEDTSSFKMRLAGEFDLLSKSDETVRSNAVQAWLFHEMAFRANKQGEYVVAENAYAKSMEFAKKSLGEDSLIYMLSECALLPVQAERNSQKDLIAKYQTHLKHVEKMFGKDSLRYARQLTSYGVALRKLKESEKSISAIKESLSISLQRRDDGSAQFYEARVELAAAMFDHGDIDESERECKFVVEQHLQRSVPYTANTAIAHTILGKIYERRGDWSEANSSFNQAIAAFENVQSLATVEWEIEAKEHFLKDAVKLEIEEFRLANFRSHLEALKRLRAATR